MKMYKFKGQKSAPVSSNRHHKCVICKVALVPDQPHNGGTHFYAAPITVQERAS